MGYRSDVAYTIRFKDVGAMTLFITEAKAKGLEPALDECDIHQDKQSDKYHINFFAEGVKWYDTYPTVQAHQALIELARDWCEGDRHEHTRQTGDTSYMAGEEYKLGFVYVEVGEEVNDCKEESDGDSDWDWLRVSRQVVGDWM